MESHTIFSIPVMGIASTMPTTPQSNPNPINAAMLGNERHAPMVQAIPLDRMLTETDGPFTREGARPSQPADVTVVVEALGRLHGLPAADVASLIRDNLRALLG